MTGAYKIWIGFILCLAVVLAAMSWVSLTALKLDEAQAEARRDEADALRQEAQARRKEAEARPGMVTPLRTVDAQYRLLIEILQARVAQPVPEEGEGTTLETQRVAEEYLSMATYVRERARITQMLSLHDVLGVLETGVDKTSPDTPPALLEQYGIVLAQVGRTEAAVEVFKRLQTSDPDSGRATEWLQRLQAEPADPDRTRGR